MLWCKKHVFQRNVDELKKRGKIRIVKLRVQWPYISVRRPSFLLALIAEKEGDGTVFLTDGNVPPTIFDVVEFDGCRIAPLYEPFPLQPGTRYKLVVLIPHSIGGIANAIIAEPL